jgi:hypothetical protein
MLCLNMQYKEFIVFKVHIFWEGHKGGDFTKFCGLLRIYGLYVVESNEHNLLFQIKEKVTSKTFKNKKVEFW